MVGGKGERERRDRKERKGERKERERERGSETHIPAAGDNLQYSSNRYQ